MEKYSPEEALEQIRNVVEGHPDVDPDFGDATKSYTDGFIRGNEYGSGVVSNSIREILDNVEEDYSSVRFLVEFPDGSPPISDNDDGIPLSEVEAIDMARSYGGSIIEQRLHTRVYRRQVYDEE